MPRPNCARMPITLTCEVIVTSVSSGARSTSELVIRMSAPPLPRTSWPLATISAVRATGSRRSKRIVPL